jgi:hypothetical protein
MDNEQRVREFQKLAIRVAVLEPRIAQLRDEMRTFVERGHQDRKYAERMERQLGEYLDEQNGIWSRLAEIDPVATADLN